MSKKKKSGGKKLTAQQLQIEILTFLLQRPKKQYSPQQIVHDLRVENNKDSAEHALRQLVEIGSVEEHSLNRYGISLTKFITALDEFEEDKPAKMPQEAAAAPTRDRNARDAERSGAKTRKVVEGRVRCCLYCFRGTGYRCLCAQ